MSYSGSLLIIKGANGHGDYNFPLSKIKADTYQMYRTIVDLDSYRDADGNLHRQALDHVPIKVEFETVPMLTNEEFADLMSEIRSRFIVAKERKLIIEAYCPETDSYIQQNVYMPDIQPKIYWANIEANSFIQYDAIRLAFIGY